MFALCTHKIKYLLGNLSEIWLREIEKKEDCYPRNIFKGMFSGYSFRHLFPKFSTMNMTMYYLNNLNKKIEMGIL